MTVEVRLMLPNGDAIMSDGSRRTAKQLEAPQPAAQLGREIASGRRAQETLERMHRKLADLPEDGMQMNAIACCIAYTYAGLSDADIAEALKTSIENVKRTKDMEAYVQFAEMLDSTVFEDAKKHAKHIISRSSARAATRMVDAVESADESVAVVAAREVLKLAGVNEGHDASRLGGLRIVIETAGAKDKQEITVSLNGE